MFPETLTTRQATQHGCLPRLLGDGDKRNGNSVVRKKIFCTGHRLEQPRQNKNLLYRHDKPNEPTKKGPLSFVLFESTLNFNSEQGPPLSSISGGPSCHSLVKTISGFPLVQFRELEANTYSRVQGRTFQSDNWNDFLHQKMFARG